MAQSYNGDLIYQGVADARTTMAGTFSEAGIETSGPRESGACGSHQCIASIQCRRLLHKAPLIPKVFVFLDSTTGTYPGTLDSEGRKKLATGTKLEGVGNYYEANAQRMEPWPYSRRI